MRRAFLVSSIALLASGCTFGHVRELHAGAVGPYRDVHAVRISVDGGAPADVAVPLAESARAAFPQSAGLAVAASDSAATPAFSWVMHVSSALEPVSGAPSSDDAVLGGLASSAGLGHLGAARTGMLAFDGDLTAPDGKRLGHLRWEGAGSPRAIAWSAGDDAVRRFGHRFLDQRDEWVDRRPADERLFLTATPLTLEKGQFLLTNDEGLLFRLGAGVGKRTQLDLWAGALPIPVAGGGPFFLIRAIGTGGGAGVVVLGFGDIGIKHRFLDETGTRPAVALSYDVLDVFLAGVGGGAVAFAGDAILAGAGGGLGGANVQFNLGTATVSKHFGRTHVVLGGYLLDNHHFLPQKASFVAGGVVSDGSGSGAGAVVTGGRKVPRLPVQYQAWLSVSHVLGEHTLLGMELLPRNPVADSFGTTGVRWTVGGHRPWGPLALDRIRMRIDLAGIWVYTPPKADRQNTDGTTTKGHGPLISPLPWVGVGFYW